MTDFERSREHMVDNQLRTSGITDWRILARMNEVPRELFVPAARAAVAYIDEVQWLEQTGSGRFIAPPATFAKLLQLAEITDADAVLDIGSASGYSAAVIAGLAGSVVGLEQSATLASSARDNLSALGLSDVRIVAGDIGQIGKGQFDVILVEGALDTVPDAFFAALRDGGRLVALMRRGAVAVASVFVKSGKGIAARDEFNAWLPPLATVKAEEEFVF